MGPMRADIARQPEVLAALLARADAFRAAGASLVPDAGGRVRTASCGDGLFASKVAALAFEALGVAFAPGGSLDAALGAPPFRPADRLLAISMSGNVDRTVEAAEAALRAGTRVLVLCNGSGGRLGERAPRVSLEIPDLAPFLCGTSSYTGIVLALIALAEGAAGRRLDGLGEAPTLVRAALAACDAAISALDHGALTGLRLLSAGGHLGTAEYGAAKLVELCATPAWSADLEEFAHSQFWAMPARDLVVLVAGDAGIAGYAADSADALAGMGVTTLAIDSAGAPVPTATYRITLPDAPAWLAPVAQAVPLQLLAWTHARARGFDPDKRLHLKDDAARFAASRKLTRRSLLGTGR